ncbi:MAG: DUF2867 domain-containing protein [Acidimicrobiales bacterium]
MRVHRAAFPHDTLIGSWASRSDYRDAYSVALPPKATGDAAAWAKAMFSSPPPVIAALVGLRDRIVAPFGLRPAGTGDHDGLPFALLAETEEEVMLGMDDRHLDFRVSVLVRENTVTVSTAVVFHGKAGRCYFAPVRLAHPLVVRAMLRRADPPSSS